MIDSYITYDSPGDVFDSPESLEDFRPQLFRYNSSQNLQDFDIQPLRDFNNLADILPLDNNFEAIDTASAYSTNLSSKGQPESSHNALDEGNYDGLEDATSKSNAVVRNGIRKHFEPIVDNNVLYIYEDDPEEYKKARKRVQNRESASRIRNRKKNEVEILRGEMTVIKKYNAELRSQNQSLVAENNVLKKQVMILEKALVKHNKKGAGAGAGAYELADSSSYPEGSNRHYMNSTETRPLRGDLEGDSMIIETKPTRAAPNQSKFKRNMTIIGTFTLLLCVYGLLPRDNSGGIQLFTKPKNFPTDEQDVVVYSNKTYPPVNSTNTTPTTPVDPVTATLPVDNTNNNTIMHAYNNKNKTTYEDPTIVMSVASYGNATETNDEGFEEDNDQTTLDEKFVVDSTSAEDPSNSTIQSFAPATQSTARTNSTQDTNDQTFMDEKTQKIKSSYGRNNNYGTYGNGSKHQNNYYNDEDFNNTNTDNDAIIAQDAVPSNAIANDTNNNSDVIAQDAVPSDAIANETSYNNDNKENNTDATDVIAQSAVTQDAIANVTSNDNSTTNDTNVDNYDDDTNADNDDDYDDDYEYNKYDYAGYDDAKQMLIDSVDEPADADTADESEEGRNLRATREVIEKSIEKEGSEKTIKDMLQRKGKEKGRN